MADKRLWVTSFVDRDGIYNPMDRMARLYLKKSRHRSEPIEESVEEAPAREVPLFVRGDDTDETVREALARLFARGAQSSQARRHRLELTEVSFLVDRSRSALEAIQGFSGTNGHIDEELKEPGSPLVTTARTSSTEKEMVTMGFFPLLKFVSVYDVRQLMRYCGMTADLQAQAQLNLAVPDFIHHFRGHSTVLQYKGWVYAHFIEYDGPETQISRDFSKHKGGRRGLNKLDQFMIGGVLKR